MDWFFAIHIIKHNGQKNLPVVMDNYASSTSTILAIAEKTIIAIVITVLVLISIMTSFCRVYKILFYFPIQKAYPLNDIRHYQIDFVKLFYWHLFSTNLQKNL